MSDKEIKEKLDAEVRALAVDYRKRLDTAAQWRQVARDERNATIVAYVGAVMSALAIAGLIVLAMRAGR